MRKIIILIAFLCSIEMTFGQHVLFREYGFYGTASYTMLTNLNRKNYAVTLNGVALSGGFEIRRQTCVELGFAFLADNSGIFTQVPIYVALRTHYLDKRITPFTEIHAGYSIPLKKTGINSNGNKMMLEEGGLSTGVNVGARFSFSRHLAVNLYVGWHLLMTNQYKVYEEEGLPKLEDAWAAQNFRFGLGLMF